MVPLLTSLLFLIVLSRLFAGLCLKFKQPTMIGEILAGVILGPSILGIIAPNDALRGISDLAVFLIVLCAGIEMDFKQTIRSLRGRGLVISVLSFAVPLAAGFGIGLAFDMDLVRSLFLGLCVSITALPVAIRILEGFNLLDSNIARYSVAAAILNDIAALVILGVVLKMPRETTLSTVSVTLLRTLSKLALLVLFVMIFNWVLKKIQQRSPTIQRINGSIQNLFGGDAVFGFVIIFTLTLSSVSEILGFHFVIGAFFAALLLSRELLGRHFAKLDHTLQNFSGSFLTPIFFAYLGLQFSLSDLRALDFVGTVLLVSILSKVSAGFFGGLLIKLPVKQALGIGIILNGRGIMELVVANIALQHGLIDQKMFSALVLMGIVTTLMTPILFKYFAQEAKA